MVKTGAVHDAQPFEKLFPLEHDVQAWLDAPVGTLAKEIPAEEKLDAALHGSQMADFFNQIQLEETGADFSCIRVLAIFRSVLPARSDDA